MKVAVFSTHKFEKIFLQKACTNHTLHFYQATLNASTADLANGFDSIAVFVNDKCDAEVLTKLHKAGVSSIALRSAGYNHVDLNKAKELGITLANVPAYSPNAIAEHTIALILALNRKLIRAHNRVMDLNFSLDGLVGFDLNEKTVGVIGTGKIGEKVIKILHGFGCKILGYDLKENEQLQQDYGVSYVELDDLLRQSDIITLHAPLTKETKYMIDQTAIAKMKRGVMLINTSRGGLVHTKDVINGLKRQQIGYLGLDVYEEEAGLFFEDHSDENMLQDDIIARLLTFKNVLITSHQAFLTNEALVNIADTTAYNLDCFEKNLKSVNEL